MSREDSSVPLMHHDPDRSWITNPDPDHPKGLHPKLIILYTCVSSVIFRDERVPVERQREKVKA